MARHPVFTIKTSDGTYDISGPALDLDTWHTVAGRYSNGQLELSVDGTELTPVPVTGTLAYPGTHKGLVVGNGFNGYMNGLKMMMTCPRIYPERSSKPFTLPVPARLPPASATTRNTRSTGPTTERHSKSSTPVMTTRTWTKKSWTWTRTKRFSGLQKNSTNNPYQEVRLTSH
ncbi:LamG domain-containing protein [Desulfatiferula olefinivorans]